MNSKSPVRVVLDTNVWLDWLIFDDASVTPLKQAQASGIIQIVINEVCLNELSAVLSYPQFALLEEQKTNHLAEVERCTIKHNLQPPRHLTALPRCSDPDDQKFLELARDSHSDWLITKDKALLGVRRGTTRIAGFRIATPLHWAESISAGTFVALP
jgi:putative PIN family toxin of toxin-antitoxin system